MADLSFSVGLDDKSYNATLRRMEGNTKKTASLLGVAFKMQAGMAALRFASGAMQAYAATSDEAARKTKELNASLNQISVGVGRDLVEGFSGANSGLKDFVGTLEKGRKAAVNFVAGLFGGDGDLLDKSRAENEALDKQVGLMKAVKLEQDKIISDQTRPMARQIEDTKMAQGGVFKDAESQHRAAMDKSRVQERRDIEDILTKTAKLTASQREQLGVTRLITEINKRGSFERSAMAIAEQDRLAEVDVAAGKMAQDAAEQAAADKQAIKDSRDGLRYDIEGREIERLRLVNRGDLADARQAELELAKQIAALEKDSTLSAGERAAAGAILTAQAHELADIGAKNRAEAARAVSSTRTMNAAAGNAGIFEQVFTAASANTSEPLAVARRSEAYLKRMTDLMSQIAGQAGGVVFQ